MKNEDPSQVAARIVRESTSKEEPLPADVEAAWERWSAGVGRIDDRAAALLRAAFEAGVEAARQAKPSNGAAELGKLGGLKGGKARAAKLTSVQRTEIAARAAAKRWGKTSP